MKEWALVLKGHSAEHRDPVWETIDEPHQGSSKVSIFSMSSCLEWTWAF